MTWAWTTAAGARSTYGARARRRRRARAEGAGTGGTTGGDALRVCITASLGGVQRLGQVLVEGPGRVGDRGLAGRDVAEERLQRLVALDRRPSGARRGRDAPLGRGRERLEQVGAGARGLVDQLCGDRGPAVDADDRAGLRRRAGRGLEIGERERAVRALGRDGQVGTAEEDRLVRARGGAGEREGAEVVLERGLDLRDRVDAGDEDRRGLALGE